MRSQFVETVTRLIEDDPDTVLMLGDIGVFAFRHLIEKYPLRAHNIGILEQSTVSAAAGLSIAGHYPIVHTIAPFLVERAYEQIKIDLCYQELGANLVSVGASYDYAGLGCTHHCPGDVSILNKIPGIEIVVPGHREEFDSLLSDNYNNGNTTYYRLSEQSNKSSYEVVLGKSNLIQEGNQLTIIAVGPMLERVVEASKDLDVTIIYCTTVKPFDTSLLKDFSSDILIVEPYYSGPLLENIERSLKGLSGSINCLGVKDQFIKNYGTTEEVDSLLGLDTLKIRELILQRIAFLGK